jgi:hypothetical protein
VSSRGRFAHDRRRTLFAASFVSSIAAFGDRFKSFSVANAHCAHLKPATMDWSSRGDVRTTPR